LKKKANGTNQNTDGFYTKTTEKGGFNKLRVKIEKDVITISHMRKRFTGFKKIKQRHIFFVLGYLRMIL
jgi:hypothetical protein